MYGLNNMFGQIPVLGLIIGGGSNEGLFAVTYEVVGNDRQAGASRQSDFGNTPGVSRKIMEFNTGKQNNPVELPPTTDRSTTKRSIARHAI